jgi:hypothetical protein
MQTAPTAASMLEFFWQSLGLRYLFFLVVCTAISLALVLLLIVKVKGPALGPALALAASPPFLVGLFGAANSAIDGCLSLSAITIPQVEDIGKIAARSSANLLVALTAGLPGYVAALVGTAYRSLMGERPRAADKGD